MIANVMVSGGFVERMTLPRPIPIIHPYFRNVYVGRRTARIVAEYADDGNFRMLDHDESREIRNINSVHDAIRAVRSPRPL